METVTVLTDRAARDGEVSDLLESACVIGRHRADDRMYRLFHIPGLIDQFVIIRAEDGEYHATERFFDIAPTHDAWAKICDGGGRYV